MSSKEKPTLLFKIGDVVRLKSGGRKITIEDTWADYGSNAVVKIIYSEKNGRITLDTTWYNQDIFEKVEEHKL